MKLSRIYLFAILAHLILNSCVDEHVVSVNENELNGTIYLTSDPGGAQIFLLGDNTGKVTPDSIENLESGSYEIELKLEDYNDTSFTLSVFKNKVTSKNVVLEKAKEFGKIVIGSSPPGASILLNNDSLSIVTPDSIINLSAGSYEILLRMENFVDTAFSVSLQKNERKEYLIELREYIPEGRIFVNTEPAGAAIFLDGISTSKVTPDTIFNLHEGSYDIGLKLENFKDTTVTVELPKDETRTVDITLVENIPEGKIIIGSEPSNAEIFLNTLTTGKFTPDSLTDLQAGEYIITLKGTDYYDSTFTINLSEDQVVSAFIELQQLPVNGDLFVDSDPAGAQIFLQGSNTFKITPDTLKDIVVGPYLVTLRLDDFIDTSVVANVYEDQTTELFVTLRDTVPAVDLDLSYRVDNSNQIFFIIKFNQRVFFDKMEFLPPFSILLFTYPYKQFVNKGEEIEIAYATKISGNWNFTFYGNQTRGRQNEFVIEKSLQIE